MFFRFFAGLSIVVLISLSGIALEKQNLSLRRELSRQVYRLAVLQNAYADSRLKAQRLGAPVRMLDHLQEGQLGMREPTRPNDVSPRPVPLLNWRQYQLPDGSSE